MAEIEARKHPKNQVPNKPPLSQAVLCATGELEVEPRIPIKAEKETSGLREVMIGFSAPPIVLVARYLFFSDSISINTLFAAMLAVTVFGSILFVGTFMTLRNRLNRVLIVLAGTGGNLHFLKEQATAKETRIYLWMRRIGNGAIVFGAAMMGMFFSKFIVYSVWA